MTEKFEIIASLPFFYSFPVKLKIATLDNKQSWSVQKWSVTIQALKSRILYWHWNLTEDQIWNTCKAYVQYIGCDYFLILWDNKTKYLGYDFQWAVFEIIVSLESPPFGAKKIRYYSLISHLASWSRFYLLSRISLPKVMLNAASRLLQAIYPQPSLFEWRGLAPPQVLPKLRGEYGTSEKGESWTQRGARDRYDGNEDRTRVESDGKEKERELHCFFSSHQSYCPLSLTINSNIPQKVIASDWGQGRGGEGAAVPRL